MQRIRQSYRTLSVYCDTRGILYIYLNRPEVRNAFNLQMMEDFLDLFKTCALETNIRAVVIQARGPIFCSGGDLEWMRRSSEMDFESNLKETKLLYSMFFHIQNCPKPVLAAVQGAAIGGGVGLLSVCDWVVTTQNTYFSLSEVKLGLIPACIAPFVVAKIGASAARALFIFAKRFHAQEALRLGLVHEVVTQENQINFYLEENLNNLFDSASGSIEAAKKMALRLTWPELRQECGDLAEYCSKILAELRVSPEGQEGVKAFLQKRKPHWGPEAISSPEVESSKFNKHASIVSLKKPSLSSTKKLPDDSQTD